MSQSISKTFTDGQLAEIVTMRVAGSEYQKIADSINKRYGLGVSAEAIRRAYNSYAHLFETGNAIGSIKVLKDIARVKRSNSQTAKENRTILQALNDREDLLEQISELVRAVPKQRATKFKMPKKAASKTDMTVEAMISDVHVGKLTKTFNLEVCRQRLRLYTQVLLGEIDRKKASYNVERVILALLGDLIENANMHGKESAVGSEFGNAQQTRYAIELLFAEVVCPLAATGLPIDVIAIAGNHDRDEEKPTFNNPGEAALSWVIYQTLKLLSDRSGFTNITWTIPDGVYATLEVYGDHILYEHGDRIKGDNSKKSFLANMVKRSGQTGQVIKGMRIGHWHEFSCLDNGTVIVNGSVPGQDSYAEVNGYNSVPGQAINFYVRTANRDNAYYHSLLVQLGGAA